MDLSDIFYFSCSGEGKGVRGARKGVRGGRIFIEKFQQGGVCQERGVGGAEGPRGCLRGIGGEG